MRWIAPLILALLLFATSGDILSQPAKGKTPAAVQPGKGAITPTGEVPKSSPAADTTGNTRSVSQTEQEAQAVVAAEDSASTPSDPLTWKRPAFTYSPGGRRDPFESLVPVENKDEKKIKDLFNYDKATLRGIVHSDSSVYALAVDSANYAYILRENDLVYGGRVSRITEDAVYLNIVQYGRAMSIVLRMDTARQTIRSEYGEEGSLKRPGITVSYGPGGEKERTVAIGDVTISSPDVQTVEETWFKTPERETADSGKQGAYLLVSPPDNASVMFPEVLRWTNSPQDSVYTVIIARDREFTEPLVVKEGLTSTFFLLEDTPGMEDGRSLFWKVVSTSKAGKRIDFRNNRSFKIVR